MDDDIITSNVEFEAISIFFSSCFPPSSYFFRKTIADSPHWHNGQNKVIEKHITTHALISLRSRFERRVVKTIMLKYV